MMKRLLALLILFALLCTLASCDGDYGEFYTEDDLLQNSLIQCVVTGTGAREISYEIRNATPYSIWIKAVRLQLYVDGAWETSIADNGYIWVDRDLFGGWRGSQKEVYEKRVNFNTMHPGEYRIIVTMQARKDEWRAQIEEFYAAACFTITDEVYGVFEQKDGILQNSLVTLQITNYSAPLLKPWYHLKNESALNVEQQKYADDGYGYLLEMHKDGAWVTCPTFGELVSEDVEQRDFWLKKQIQVNAAALMEKRYIALEAGEYRMRVKYTASSGVDGVEIPEGQLEAVAYFTVTAE